MAYDGTLKFDTSMDATGFQKGANKLGDIVKGLSVFKLMEKGFQLITDSMDRAVSRYDTLDRFPRIMEQMGFSAEDASSSINKLSDGVQGLPTALDEITGSTQRIASMTGDLEGATDLSLALNNAFLASGASADAASRGLEQYMQIISRGKPEMEDWKTIQETMPYALQQVAESFGFAGTSATRDFYSALKDGEITVEEMNTRFIELSTTTGGFAELAKTSTGGIGTAITNLKNRTAAGLADIIKAINTGFSKTRFKSIENIINTTSTGIKKALTGVAQAFGFVAENSEVILPLLVGIGATVAGWKIGEVLTGLIGKFQTASMWVTRLAVSQAGAAAAEASFATASAIANAGLGVKEVLVGVLTGKIGLATAAQWAWNTAMNANPIGVIIGLIALLVTACVSLHAVFMNSLSPAYQQQKAEIDAMNESMDAHISAMDDAIKKGEEAVTTAKAEAITNQQLVDRLTALTAIENRSAEEKAELADVTAQLAKEFPELNLQYDKEQDELNQSTASVEKYVAAKNKIAETTALQERASEEQSAYNQLEADMIVLKEKALAINEDENMNWVEKNFLLEELWGQYQENDKALKDHAKTVEAAQKAVGKSSTKEEQAYINATEALQAKTESGGSLLKQYAHDYGMTTDQILAEMRDQEVNLETWQKNMQANFTESGMDLDLLAQKWGMTVDEVKQSCAEWGMSYDEFNEHMKATHTEAGEDINDLAAQWGVSVAEIQNWIAMNESDVQGWSDMMEEDWENYRKAVQENVDTIINGMEPLPTKMDYNLKQMTQTLSKNAEKYKAWKDKMAQVSSQLTPEVLQYLSDLGPGTTQILDEIIKDTSGKKAQELNEAYGKVGEAAKEGINEQQPAVKAAFTDLADGGAEGLTESTAAVDAAGEIAKDVATTISNGDYSGLTDNMSASIREGLGSVKAAMQILQDVVGDILKAMDKDAQGSAANMMAGINSTIITRSYPAQSSAASVAKGIVTALGVMVTTAKGVMVNTMNGMLVAMNEKAPILYDKANTIATKISETMEKALEVGSPSKVMIRLFGWVMQGIYDGMESMEGLVFGEADTIATGIADRLDISKDMARSMVGNLRSVTTAGNLGGSALTMQTAAAGGAPGGVNYYTNLTQYNTSPKALSPAELTQEAQDMLRRARWQLP